MSRLLAVALAAVMLFAAVPAFAEEVTSAPAADEAAVEGDAVAVGDGEAAAALECANPDGLEVVTLEGAESEIAAPGLRLVDTEAKSFVVDLGAGSPDATGELTVGLAWDALLNDYDLEVTGDETVRSENAQPFDASEEAVTLTVAHCQVIEVVAYNFFALQPATTLALTFGAVEAVEEDAATAAAVPSLAALESLTGQEALEVLEAEVLEAEAAQVEAQESEALEAESADADAVEAEAQ